jgi:hypothetical protein
MEERMAESGTNVPGAQVDRALEVFGETVIIRSDPAGALVNVAVIEEIVPAGVAAPFHRHDREDEISYVIVSDRWWLARQDSLISQWFIRHPLPSLSLREAAGKHRAVFRGKSSTRQLVERSPRGPRIPVIRKITASSVFVTPSRRYTPSTITES